MTKPRPLLSIVGPTATGKTDFALQLYDLLPDLMESVDIISADSRQVYEGLEITSGADVDESFWHEGLYGDEELTYGYIQTQGRLHGVSIIPVDEEWSVAHFRKMAQEVIQFSLKHTSLPVIVGGTGLYHQHVLTDDVKLDVKPEEQIRFVASTMTVEQLQDWLKNVDSEKFNQMNRSDQMNPRRLVRAIEISYGTKIIQEPTIQIIQPMTELKIGLTDSIENITERITKRVEDRIKNGAIREVEMAINRLEEKQIKSLPAFSATGVKEIIMFLEGKIDEQQLRELWIRREVQYAKRQLTWWKKQKDIQWFNVSEPGWQDAALDVIRNWLHHQVYEET